MLPFQKILCPTDFSPSSRLSLARAADLAAHFDAQLLVLHVVPIFGNESGDEAFTLADYHESARVAAQKRIAEEIECAVPRGVDAQVLVHLGGKEANEIAKAAVENQANLVVIATHGSTGWRHLVFGSVTEKVLHIAHCSVLVIRGEK